MKVSHDFSVWILLEEQSVGVCIARQHQRTATGTGLQYKQSCNDAVGVGAGRTALGSALEVNGLLDVLRGGGDGEVRGDVKDRIHIEYVGGWNERVSLVCNWLVADDRLKSG